MFRKLAGAAAATVAMTSFLTVTAVPAHAEGGAATITIQYDGATLPNAGGAYQVNGTELVGSITGVLDGEAIDATSCHVDVTSLDALLAGQSVAVLGDCAGDPAAAAFLAPRVGPEGGVLTDGDVSTAIFKWEVRGKCKGRWLFGVPVWVECEVEVKLGNQA